MPKDRPSGGAGLPNLFPAWTDRAQLKYMNPAVKRVARYLPTFAIVKHRGRKSGRDYETVVNAYRKGDRLAILLGHGETDWVKNVVAAGEAEVNLLGKDLRITNTRVLPVAGGPPSLAVVCHRGAAAVAAQLAERRREGHRRGSPRQSGERPSLSLLGGRTPPDLGLAVVGSVWRRSGSGS
ncbi:hypothetical protein OKHIL_37790 [Mycolicibacterium mageritense]